MDPQDRTSWDFTSGASSNPRSGRHGSAIRGNVVARATGLARIRIDEDDESSEPESTPESPSSVAAKRRAIVFTEQQLGRDIDSGTAGASAMPTIMEDTPLAVQPLANRPRAHSLKRWDPETAMTTAWNAIQRDTELWYEDGNCLVYTTSKDDQKRCASFKVPLATIHTRQFSNIFHTYESQIAPAPAQYYGDPTINSLCELFMPPPTNLTADRHQQWHITTRNFFAFLLDRPVVGGVLSRALFDLHDRLILLRPHSNDNARDFFQYLNRMGYLELGHNPDYALTMMKIAEKVRIHDLWVDAFTHCVGMNDILEMSVEYETTSALSRALLTRSYLEMDAHLGKVTGALSNFLEDALSPARLGLGPSLRTHLDRFRSFLHTFYVEKFGYWPPPSGRSFNKTLYRAMYFDFRDLYDLLVDTTSSDDLQAQKPASGGICVLQNIKHFNKKQKFLPLSHPLPLVPDQFPDCDSVYSQKRGLMSKLNRQPKNKPNAANIQVTLLSTVNKDNLKLFSSPLVRAYLHYEKEWATSRDLGVSVSDGRKVRWILIYGMLQMLISIIRAPKEVRDTDGPSYPLCCLVTDTPPWIAGKRELLAAYGPAIGGTTELIIESEEEEYDAVDPTETAKVEISPDCDVRDFITPLEKVQTASSRAKSSTDEARPSSKHSSSLRGLEVPFRSLSRLGRHRKDSAPESPEISVTPVVRLDQPKFCAIVIEGYGDGQEAPDMAVQHTMMAAEESYSLLESDAHLPGNDQPMIPAPVVQIIEESPVTTPSEMIVSEAWPLPAAASQTKAELRTPCMDDEEMRRMYRPYIHASGSEYSVSSVGVKGGDDQTSQEKDLVEDVIISELKKGDCDSNRNSSQTSGSSADTAPGPPTPRDEQPLPILFTAEPIPELDLELAPESKSSEPERNPNRESLPPAHGIRIKRTFSVESFNIDSESSNTTPQITRNNSSGATDLLKFSMANLHHQSSHDYLVNNLDRTSSVTSVRSSSAQGTHFSRPLRYLAPSPLPFQRSSSIDRVPETKSKSSRWGLPSGLSKTISRSSSAAGDYDDPKAADLTDGRAPSRAGSIVGSRLKRLYFA